MGKTLILLRRGKPVAEVIPFADEIRRTPSWKKPGIQLKIQGSSLSSAILDERKENH